MLIWVFQNTILSILKYSTFGYFIILFIFKYFQIVSSFSEYLKYDIQKTNFSILQYWKVFKILTYGFSFKNRKKVINNT